MFIRNTNLNTSIFFESDYRSIDIERIFELKENYNHFIDIFFRYIGINCFEREDNYVKYKDFKLNEKTETFTFEEILDRIKN